MAGEIKAGDKVRLKSDPTVMVAEWVAEEWGTEKALCVWLDAKKHRAEAKFSTVALEKVP